MPLIEYTLFEIIDKVKTAIARLREFEPPEGYYLAFSGGKDSCVIKELADLAGVKYDAHYNVSGIDPPELIRFIKEYHSEVRWDRHDIPFLTRLAKHGFPIRQGRWCCEKYKEAGGKGRLVVTGVRWAESPRRKRRNMTEACYNHPGKRFLHVIIDWDDADVWEFLKGRDIPYCKLYDEGFARLGCIACPCQSPELRAMEMKRWPGFNKAFRVAFRKLYKNRVESGKTDGVKRWKDGDEMYKWWLGNDPAPREDDEPGLFT